MVSTTLDMIVQPLIQQHIFSTPVEAVHTLVQDYVDRQLRRCEKKITRFEKQYGMKWEQFDRYTAARTATLREADLTTEQRQTLSQAIMQEEDDWLEWKAFLDMRKSWQTLLAIES